jgi:tetratricopeptide (TPR) repeat protein
MTRRSGLVTRPYRLSTMIRLLSTTGLLGLLALGSAVPAGGQDKSPKSAPKLYTITLAVSPAPVPVPALKYELFPPARARVPGNAAVDYQRAALLLPPSPRDAKKAQQQNEEIDRWFGTPLDQLPAGEVEAFLKPYKPAFAAFDRAVRYERCDWQLGPYLSPEHRDGLLTESQKYRELIYYHRLRLKTHLAANNFDDAIGNLQSGFRLAKDMAESPTSIRMLIGISLAAITTSGVEEWIGRPDAPNLYWALDALPKPLIDPRPALEGEAAFVNSSLAEPEELLRGSLPAENADRVLGKMVCSIPGACPPPEGFLMGLAHRTSVSEFAAKAAPNARADLLTLGKTQAEIARMTDSQAVALRVVLTLRSTWDEQIQVFRMPYPRAVEALKKLTERARVAAAGGDQLLARYAMDSAALEKVYHAYIRIGRRLAGLQAVEAVRLHLASNKGVVPARLSDVTIVAVPDDPQTCEPFEYAATPTGFTLSAPATDGQTAHAGNSFRYDVTVRK